MAGQAGRETAVIIDEYGKPLLAAIGAPDIHKKSGKSLKPFTGF
jgi:hypothetical protein